MPFHSAVGSLQQLQKRGKLWHRQITRTRSTHSRYNIYMYSIYYIYYIHTYTFPNMLPNIISNKVLDRQFPRNAVARAFPCTRNEYVCYCLSSHPKICHNVSYHIIRVLACWLCPWPTTAIRYRYILIQPSILHRILSEFFVATIFNADCGWCVDVNGGLRTSGMLCMI